MLTRMELLRLERSLRGTRTLSVYLDGPASDPAERTVWRRTLSAAVDDARDALRDAPHDEREAFERAVGWLDARLEATPTERRAPGWVAFATEDGVCHAEALPASVPTVVAWGDGVRMAPYLRVARWHRPAVVAIVDARSARVFTYRDRALAARRSMHAHAHAGPVTHMGSAPAPGFHPGTRGETGTDEAERARRIGRERMLGELAERLVSLAGADGWILVGGIPEVAAAALAQLSDEVRARARRLDGLDVHATFAEIAARAADAMTEMQRAADSAAVDDVLARYGAGGTAAVGREAIAEALREGALDRLYLTARFLDEAPRAVEEIVRAAYEQDAQVSCVGGAAAERLDADAGGIAARLRFQLAREQPRVLATRQ